MDFHAFNSACAFLSQEKSNFTQWLCTLRKMERQTHCELNFSDSNNNGWSSFTLFRFLSCIINDCYITVSLNMTSKVPPCFFHPPPCSHDATDRSRERERESNQGQLFYIRNRTTLSPISCHSLSKLIKRFKANPAVLALYRTA